MENRFVISSDQGATSSRAIFEPVRDAGAMSKPYRGWQRALERARKWADVEV
jgi:glycerol kinase